MESLNQFLARQLLNKTRKGFSTLFADYQEQIMSTATSEAGMNVNSPVSPTVIKNVDARTISVSHADSTVSPNTGANLTDAFKTQAGPRGETTSTENAGG